MLATDYACLGLGVLVVLPILAKCFQLPDVLLIIVGILGRIVRLIMLVS